MLHTDTSLLPIRRHIWSSWNYLIPKKDSGRAALTYDMNILQSIQSPDEFCVTLNRPDDIDANKEIGRFLYHHPVFMKDAPAAQRRHRDISGKNRTHYCGAYWGSAGGQSSRIDGCAPWWWAVGASPGGGPGAGNESGWKGS